MAYPFAALLRRIRVIHLQLLRLRSLLPTVGESFLLMVSTSLETARGVTGYATPDASVSATVITPTDRVRWGPIFAGLLCTLTTLAVLSVLGLAIGATAYDADDRMRSFGIGAGIWAAVSALIAFFVGGMLSARTSATTGQNNAILQGAMVWMVAVPLLAYMMVGLVGTAARATNSAVNTTAQVTNTAVTTGQPAPAAPTPTTDQLKVQAQQLATPENAEAARSATAKAAWGTLLSLVLGLGAAAAGGMVGVHGFRRSTVAVPA
jgi:hypothetical protein